MVRSVIEWLPFAEIEAEGSAVAEDGRGSGSTPSDRSANPAGTRARTNPLGAYDFRVELVEVVLYVRDMERAVGFYREALDMPVDYESAGWTTFRTGACTLALHATERRTLGAAEPDPTFLVANDAMERQRLIAASVDVTEIRRPVVGGGIRRP